MFKKKTNIPPFFASKLLEKILVKSIRYGGIGDFSEMFVKITEKSGRITALGWYWLQILRMLPSYLVDKIYWNIAMLNNYFIIAFRNLKRQKGFSFINISGLSIGIASSILVLMYVMDEFSYDTFHEKANRVFRIQRDITFKSGFRIHSKNTPTILNSFLKDVSPEIEDGTRICLFNGTILNSGENVFNENRCFGADEGFFNVFSFKVIRGDLKSMLSEPNSIVLTKSAAEKYYHNIDPMNKILNVNVQGTDYQLKVTGLTENVPDNSHFKYDFLISLKTFDFYHRNTWNQNSVTSYILLRPGVNINDMQTKLGEILRKHAYDGKESGWIWSLNNIRDIHLHSDLASGVEANGNILIVYSLSFIAVFIVVIACINYMNLSTAKSMCRIKEVGVRKVLGSKRIQIARQFVVESLVICLASFIISIVLVKIMLPYFNNFTGKELGINIFSNFQFSIILVLVLIGVVVLSSIYPAIFMSSFKSISVLKNQGFSGKTKGSAFLRNGLVVFQFSISIFLIISTLVVYMQLNYIRNKDLGFNKEQVLIVNNVDKLENETEIFRESVMSIQGVENAAGSAFLPGAGFVNLGIAISGMKFKDYNMTVDINAVDPEMFETLKMKLVQGRFLSREFYPDTASIVINEETVKYFNLENPIGKEIQMSRNKRFTIVGVLQNIHYESLRENVKCMAIRSFGEGFFFEKPKMLFVRVHGANFKNTIDSIKSSWDKLSGGLEFEYTFLDEEFDKIYKTDSQLGDITGTFSLLAILISCLGLFGLSAYMAEQRIKEIGIRKVLGASTNNIIKLMTGDLTKLVIIANMIAWPTAWYIMKNWLSGFAYRIDPGLGIFVISGIIALLIGAFSVGFQTIKAAVSNPADSLKYE